MERKHHKKRKQLHLKTREINGLMGKNSPLSLKNKLLIYKTVLKPIRTYGIALWGCASKSNSSYTAIPIETPTYHNKCALVRNQTNTSLATYTSRTYTPFCKIISTNIDQHWNPLMEPLIHTTHTWKLKRRWTFDVINSGVVSILTPGSTTQPTAY